MADKSPSVPQTGTTKNAKGHSGSAHGGEGGNGEKAEKVPEETQEQSLKAHADVTQGAKAALPDIRPGQTVRVYQKIAEGGKERVQVFEGLVLAAKHGKGINGTITVRKVSQGYGVEKIFPLASPLIEKIEVMKRAKVRRAKLYHLRDPKARRLKAVGKR